MGTNLGAEWSPDGKTLAIATDQETIQLLDSSSFEELARLRTPIRKRIEALRFNDSGTVLYAQVAQRQIHRWDVGNVRQRLKELKLDW